MKKIISTIFALILFVFPLRAAQEVEITQQQYDELIAYLSDVLSVTDDNTAATENLEGDLRGILNLYKWFISRYPSGDATNNTTYYSFYTFSTNLVSTILKFRSDYLAQNLKLLAAQNNTKTLVNSILSDTDNLYSVNTNMQQTLAQQLFQLRLLELYASTTDSNLNDLINAFRYRLPGETWIPDLINIPDTANTYSNLLSSYLRSYTNQIERQYLSIYDMALAASNNLNIAYKNLRYHYYKPWGTISDGNIFDDSPFTSYWLNDLATFRQPWDVMAGVYVGDPANFDEPGVNTFDVYQSYMQYLNTLPGYRSFRDMVSQDTIGGLLGGWNSDHNTLDRDPEKVAAALNLFDPVNIANNSADKFFQNFNIHFGDGTTNIIEIGATNIADLLTINQAVANAMIAGKLGKMADNLQKVADKVEKDKTNKLDKVEEGLTEIAIQVTNLVSALVSDGITFPETVISNVEEMVNREDYYETNWRGFYSPDRMEDVNYIRDRMEEEFRPALQLTDQISNKLNRTSSILTPENSGINRFLTKVRNYTLRNPVSSLPVGVTVFNFDEINTYLERNDCSVRFNRDMEIDFSDRIFSTITYNMFFEAVRDIFKIAYAAMALYFSFRLTLLILYFVSGVVKYLGIYLNIKALQIK